MFLSVNLHLLCLNEFLLHVMINLILLQEDNSIFNAMMKNYKLIYVFVFLLSFSIDGKAQELKEFNTVRLKTAETLMFTYGSWSVANLALSSYGWATTDYEAKYFHQMNFAWSVVNLAIAIPSYIRARRTDPASFSFSQTWKAQNKTEKAFIFNTAFDLTYISIGAIMKTSADPASKHYDRLQGYGNSFIMQGSFIFLLDLTAAIIHTKHRQKKLDSFWDQIDMSDVGFGFKYTFSNNESRTIQHNEIELMQSAF